MVSRRNLLITSGLALAAGGGGYWWSSRKSKPASMGLTETEMHDAQALLAKFVSVDVHAHPGRSFIANAENLSAGAKMFTLAGSFEEASVADMQAGSLTAASFAVVSDFQVLSVGKSGISAGRDFEPGEAWQSYLHQMAQLQSLVESGLVIPILQPSDLDKAKQQRKVGALMTAEGGDFLAGSLDHLDQAYSDGLRSITLVHYHINEIGDIQTAPAKHGGLTAFGKQLVTAMNEKGMLIDLAHASRDTALATLAASSKPVMISHTAIRGEGFDSPRFINLDLAQQVAASGGVIGAWPAGIGLQSLADFSDQILRVIDLIGVDHVVLGTDMDANYKPVLDNYRQLPTLVASLLKRGLSEAEIGQFLGGNFSRVFAEVTAKD